MRIVLILALFSGLAFTACSQEVAKGNVPSIIQNSLKAKYPEAVSVEWEKANDTYVADFKLGATDYEAIIDATGNILMAKQEISLTELPAAITSAVSAEFKDFRIDDTEKLEKNGITYYQVELEKRFTEKKLVFASDGTKTDAISYWD